MCAASGGTDAGGADDSYARFMWKRRPRRAMKYVSMPIVSVPGQPREQVRPLVVLCRCSHC